jgi:transposase
MRRRRRVKTDKRDALALAEACRLGAYRPAHRTSEEQRHVRALLTVRDSLVRSRARPVTLTQAVLSRDGFRGSTGSSGCFGDRVKTLELSEPLRVEIASLFAALPPLNEQIQVLDEKLGEVASRDERVRRPARRRRGTRPQAQRDSLRDVEGRLGIRPRKAEGHAAQRSRAGGLRTGNPSPVPGRRRRGMTGSEDPAHPD